MRRLLIAALALAPLAAAAAEEPGLSSFTLGNGLQGVVIEDHRAPVVTQILWYKVGSADEPPGQSGIAHFLEHLMFKATARLEDGAFSRIVAENGGTDNAFTSADYTGYISRLAADRLDLVMGMEADRMVNLAPTPEGVRAERDVVLEERRQMVESRPTGPYNEARRAALYLNHPYGHPVIGWEHEIEGYDWEKALAFYRDHYAPNNAVLVVAGDVDPAEVERLAQKHFGPIPASERIAPRSRPQEPEHRAARRVEMFDARVAEPSVSRMYLAPSRRPGGQAEAAALSVLAELLGGSAVTSVMAQDLVFGAGLAVDAGAYYSELGLDPQTFGLYLAPRPGVSLQDAEAALDALIARFVAEGPDPAQLARVKGQIRADHVYERDDQGERARRVGEALASGLSLQDVTGWPDALDAVTPEDVRAAAERLFVPERSVTGWLMPAEIVPEVGQ